VHLGTPFRVIVVGQRPSGVLLHPLAQANAEVENTRSPDVMDLRGTESILGDPVVF
jgi:hypothetical protein